MEPREAEPELESLGRSPMVSVCCLVNLAAGTISPQRVAKEPVDSFELSLEMLDFLRTGAANLDFDSARALQIATRPAIVLSTAR